MVSGRWQGYKDLIYTGSLESVANLKRHRRRIEKDITDMSKWMEKKRMEREYGFLMQDTMVEI